MRKLAGYALMVSGCGWAFYTAVQESRRLDTVTAAYVALAEPPLPDLTILDMSYLLALFSAFVVTLCGALLAMDRK